MKTSHTSFNYSPPAQNDYNIVLSRYVVQANIMKQKLELMPGFRVTWHYSGIEVEPEAKYYNDNKAFVRNYSNHIRK